MSMERECRPKLILAFKVTVTRKKKSRSGCMLRSSEIFNERITRNKKNLGSNLKGHQKRKAKSSRNKIFPRLEASLSRHSKSGKFSFLLPKVCYRVFRLIGKLKKKDSDNIN